MKIKRELGKFLSSSLIALYLTFLPQTSQLSLAKESENEKGKQTIYLTIDDGPRQNMDAILEKLEKNKVTFFMIGEYLATSKGFDLACKALELGHEIGNHSYSHPQFSKISLDKAKEEILKTDTLIEKVYSKVGHKRAKLFRFPYRNSGGDNKKEIISFLKNQGYSVYSWDVDSQDWMYYSKKYKKSLMDILKNIEKTKENDIVLVHDLQITAEHIIPFYTHSDKYNLETLTNAK